MKCLLRHICWLGHSTLLIPAATLPLRFRALLSFFMDRENPILYDHIACSPLRPKHGALFTSASTSDAPLLACTYGGMAVWCLYPSLESGRNRVACMALHYWT